MASNLTKNNDEAEGKPGFGCLYMKDVSCRSLRIMKRSEEIGLAPRAVKNSKRQK
ncbi:Auxin-induced protein [Arachis hypogaea]|nr:Auxin-induced protein [Arachis hypogaea]